MKKLLNHIHKNAAIILVFTVGIAVLSSGIYWGAAYPNSSLLEFFKSAKSDIGREISFVTPDLGHEWSIYSREIRLKLRAIPAFRNDYFQISLVDFDTPELTVSLVAEQGHSYWEGARAENLIRFLDIEENVLYEAAVNLDKSLLFNEYFVPFSEYYVKVQLIHDGQLIREADLSDLKLGEVRRAFLPESERFIFVSGVSKPDLLSFELFGSELLEPRNSETVTSDTPDLYVLQLLDKGGNTLLESRVAASLKSIEQVCPENEVNCGPSQKRLEIQKYFSFSRAAVGVKLLRNGAVIAESKIVRYKSTE